MKPSTDASDEIQAEQELARTTEKVRSYMHIFNQLPQEQQNKIKRDHAIDFAYGQLACMRNGCVLTREEIGVIYDRMQSDKGILVPMETEREDTNVKPEQ